MSEDINNLNNGDIPKSIGQTETSYKNATALGNDWQSTEVPLPPQPPFIESNQGVVAVSEKKGFPLILIPLFIIIIGVFAGVSFLLYKQTQKKNIQAPVQISPSVVASPTLVENKSATPTAEVSISISPTNLPPSDSISDIENDFNKLDTSVLDIP